MNVNKTEPHVKLFGDRASRVTTDEMFTIFNEIGRHFIGKFRKIQLSKSLHSKLDHGDIDITILDDNKINFREELTHRVADKVLQYSKNGNIHSVLFHSNILNKNVHVDFIITHSDEEYDPQYEYLSYNDFSGVLGVMSRQLKFNYGTQGFFKIYRDKRDQNNYIRITTDLREGLRILGFDNITAYDNILTLNDIVDFISSSPLFSSDYYVGQTMNNSDRKRVRSGRPSADYIRESLILKNKVRSIEDHDFFLKKIYPEYYKNLSLEIEKIENSVIVKCKYNGLWAMTNFPMLKPGPKVGKVLKFWVDKYGSNLNNVDESVVLDDTFRYLITL